MGIGTKAADLGHIEEFYPGVLDMALDAFVQPPNNFFVRYLIQGILKRLATTFCRQWIVHSVYEMVQVW